MQMWLAGRGPTHTTRKAPVKRQTTRSGQHPCCCCDNGWVAEKLLLPPQKDACVAHARDMRGAMRQLVGGGSGCTREDKSRRGCGACALAGGRDRDPRAHTHLVIFLSPPLGSASVWASCLATRNSDWAGDRRFPLATPPLRSRPGGRRGPPACTPGSGGPRSMAWGGAGGRPRLAGHGRGRQRPEAGGLPGCQPYG